MINESSIFYRTNMQLKVWLEIHTINQALIRVDLKFRRSPLGCECRQIAITNCVSGMWMIFAFAGNKAWHAWDTNRYDTYCFYWSSLIALVYDL